MFFVILDPNTFGLEIYDQMTDERKRTIYSFEYSLDGVKL